MLVLFISLIAPSMLLAKKCNGLSRCLFSDRIDIGPLIFVSNVRHFYDYIKEGRF